MSPVVTLAGKFLDIESEFTCSSGLIRCFALYNLCDLNPTSWATSVVKLVEQLP